MAEFLNDAQRENYIDGLLNEKAFAAVHGLDDRLRAVEAELKRLRVPARRLAGARPASRELDGEFASPEQRAAHVEALKDELRGYQAAGDTHGAAAVEAELKRLAVKAKTRAEIDEASARAAEENREEPRINPAAATR